MKTITVLESTYLNLLSLKENDDNFCDLIDRILSERTRDIRPLQVGSRPHIEEPKTLT